GEIQKIDPGKFTERKITKSAKLSVIIFCFFIAAIVLFGSFRDLSPSWMIDGKKVSLSIPEILEILMLLASCIMVLCCKISPANVIKNSVFQSGMMGVVSVFGIAWMMDTFFAANRQLFIDALSGVSAFLLLFNFLQSRCNSSRHYASWLNTWNFSEQPYSHADSNQRLLLYSNRRINYCLCCL
uniref:anaerobic C4-dicarboxylate transporter family protein n=1 Tax=Turicimonas muris TaxID=1796652 RepID=UPI0026DF2563